MRTRTARRLVGRVALLELTPRVLARALDAFPGPEPLRTLYALHLASCAYLADQGQEAVALKCARLHVPAPRAERDALIAATAIVHGMTVVTGYVADFEATGVALIDPWTQT